MAQETTPRRSDKFDFDKGRKSQKFDFSKENEKVETHAQARRGRTPLCVAAVAIAAVCAVTAAYSLRGGNSADEPAKQRAGLEASGNTTDRSQTAKADTTSGQTAEPPSPAEGSTAAAGAKTVNMSTRPARTEDAAPCNNASAETAVGPEEANPYQKHGEDTGTHEPRTDEVELAMEVIRGAYGNGESRKERLGARYASVQSRVNAMYRGKSGE